MHSISAYREHYLPATDAQPSSGSVKVTFYGTSTLLFDDGTTQILIDAFLTRPALETLVTSLNTGKALIQTDTAVVDRWLRCAAATAAARVPEPAGAG